MTKGNLLLLLVILLTATGAYYGNKWFAQVMDRQFGCTTDSDCVLATNLPGYASGLCVNNSWLYRWNNSNAEMDRRLCPIGPYCTGPRWAANNATTPNACTCTNKICVKTNLVGYAGCIWRECPST